MSVYAVVPVKAPLKSKTRLSAVLVPQERKTLTLTMLEDVLKALKSSVVSQIVVISSDSTVQGLARRFDAVYLAERQIGLNEAIEQATEWCVQKKAGSVLVLAADLPLIIPDDINQMIELGIEEPSVVISSSSSGGTNAVLQKPPNLIPACFGPNSFMEHLNRAMAIGISAKSYSSFRVATDVDSIDDLKNFLRVGNQTVSHRFLERIGFCERLVHTYGI